MSSSIISKTTCDRCGKVDETDITDSFNPKNNSGDYTPSTWEGAPSPTGLDADLCPDCWEQYRIWWEMGKPEHGTYADRT